MNLDWLWKSLLLVICECSCWTCLWCVKQIENPSLWGRSTCVWIVWNSKPNGAAVETGFHCRHSCVISRPHTPSAACVHVHSPFFCRHRPPAWPHHRPLHTLLQQRTFIKCRMQFAKGVKRRAEIVFVIDRRGWGGLRLNPRGMFVVLWGKEKRDDMKMKGNKQDTTKLF